jgi:hypothetical protein
VSTYVIASDLALIRVVRARHIESVGSADIRGLVIFARGSRFQISVSIRRFHKHEMFKCHSFAMSVIESSRSLLGQDDELPIQRWKEGVAARNFNCRRRIWAITLLLIPLATFFVLYRQWHAEFNTPWPKLSENLGHAEDGRDLKWLLHPEDHVSRDPGARNFSWNITKATIAPNGVKKLVFLINGITNLCLIF